MSDNFTFDLDLKVTVTSVDGTLTAEVIDLSTTADAVAVDDTAEVIEPADDTSIDHKDVSFRFSGDDKITDWPFDIDGTTPLQSHSMVNISDASSYREGVPYMSLEVRPGDPQWTVDGKVAAPNNHKRRMEMSCNDDDGRFDPMQEFWTGIAFRMPSDPMKTCKGGTFFQLHCYPLKGVMLNCFVWDGVLKIVNTTNGEDVLYEGPADKYFDKWCRLVTHQKPSTGSDGFQKVWIDGELLVDDSGKNMASSGKGPYPKFGPYSWGYYRWGGDSNRHFLVHYDCFTIGGEDSNYDSVNPALFDA